MDGIINYKQRLYIITTLGFLLILLISCEKNLSQELETIQEENILTESTNYAIVGTGQSEFYNNTSVISEVSGSNDFFGQDANYPGATPKYIDNGDGTISDLITGLMWQQDPGGKMTWAEASAGANMFYLAGYSDWRLPTIKEIYSLMNFSGIDPGGYNTANTSSLTPFIDTDYFTFYYGDESSGERIIDAQFATSTVYTATTMGGNTTMFGLNLADGRIKGYPIEKTFNEKTYFVLYVRGNKNYGVNQFIDNADGTITDHATGLMWMTTDSEKGMNWQDALNYAKNLEHAGYSDWRLPNAKELQSIVDYNRSPESTGTAAIDPVFNCTEITNEAGQKDFSCYWTSTTHSNTSQNSGSNAVYISFGRAMGYFMGQWQDVHGAGAQRSDPKTGNANDYPYGHGPQGDAVRIQNYVRCVRNITVEE